MQKEGESTAELLGELLSTYKNSYLDMSDKYHAKCDEVKELLILNGELRKLLIDNNIESEL